MQWYLHIWKVRLNNTVYNTPHMHRRVFIPHGNLQKVPHPTASPIGAKKVLGSSCLILQAIQALNINVNWVLRVLSMKSISLDLDRPWPLYLNPVGTEILKKDTFDATLVQDSCERVSGVDVIRVTFRGARALDAIAIRCCTLERHVVDKARIQGPDGPLQSYAL